MDLLRQVLATRAGRIGIAVGLIAALTFLIAGLLRATGALPSFWDGWWWTMRHLIDPGSLGDDQTWGERLLGLLVTLTGIVIFLGVVLAVLTEVITQSLQRLQNAAVPVHVRDQVVFVGWSERLPDVIRTLATATSLQGVTPWSRHVVVIANPLENEQADTMRSRLLPKRGPLHIHLIATTADEHGFELANCRAAQAIVILRDESRYEDPTVQDLESVRRALALAQVMNNGEDQGRGPAVFFDMAHGANTDAARKLVPSGYDPLVSDRMLSAMLRDSLLEPAWSEAMDIMLSPGVRPSIAIFSDTELEGLRFGDLSGRLQGGTALAWISSEGLGVVVAPPPEMRLMGRDQIIVLQGGNEPRLVAEAALEPVDLHPEETRNGPLRRVLLVGWNSKVPTYVEELALTLGAKFQVTSLSLVPEADRGSQIARQYREAVQLNILLGNPLRREDLEAVIAATDPQAIIITSTPVWGRTSAPDVLRAADADALLTLMHTDEFVSGHQCSIIVDLFDPSRAEAFRSSIQFTTVPTTSIFASVVCWLVIEPRVNKPVSALFADPRVRRTSAVFQPTDGTARPFAAVHRALLERRQVALGVMTDTGLRLNPPADHVVNAGDRLLVIERMEKPAPD